MKILMVCLGNICRSPLAEGIFRKKADDAGFTCEVDSAGTGGWHIDEPPHLMSQKIAGQNNIDISGLRARKFRPHDMKHFDFVFFMDDNNLKDARRISGEHWVPEKASLLLDHLPEQPHREVPDPYYGDFEDYQFVFGLLNSACQRIIENLQRFGRPGE
ncbi:MAG: low molecular weight phosphotyrosine protein phosphatase [Chitinophagaceae bacterium]|jgi:protein-tyrosine phosphatase|nr:low molecular weight phosphotyrosine protein phosphatase [Chitinophagaceae bacterium]